MVEIRGLLVGLILGSITSILILQHINMNIPHIHHVFRYLEANTGDTCIGSPWQQVRVSVFILTTHKNWHTKGIAVQRTWAKRFDHYKFIYSTNKTSQNIDEVPSNSSDNIRTHQSSSRNRIPSGLPVNISEGREHLTAKSLHGFLYLYKHYLDSSEWFMKADDDTYVIVENLKLFLSKFEPTEPILIGYRFWHEQNTAKKGHMSGGAGYVLSKAALKLLVERGLKYKALCPRDGGSEDVILAVCLYNLGVKFIDAFDLFGNTRFHPFDPLTLLNGLPTKQGDFHYRNIMGNLKSRGALSTESITFHYVNPGCMYMYDFLIYELKSCVKKTH